MVIKKLITYTAFVTLLLMPVSALAADPVLFGTTVPFAGTSPGPLANAIRNIVNSLLGLAAIVAVIYVIIGGVRYITAQGDEDSVTLAKSTIIYAIIGIIIISLSALIINFVINSIN